jgi:hypothetical protein
MQNSFAIFILKCCIHEGTPQRLTKYSRCASLALREIAFGDFVNRRRYMQKARARGRGSVAIGLVGKK